MKLPNGDRAIVDIRKISGYCLSVEHDEGKHKMAIPREPQLLDLVAVLQPPPGADVMVGDVGTVVELLPPDGLEVEFLDRSGKTLCVATLSTGDVLVLNRQRTPVG